MAISNIDLKKQVIICKKMPPEVKRAALDRIEEMLMMIPTKILRQCLKVN